MFAHIFFEVRKVFLNHIDIVMEVSKNIHLLFAKKNKIYTSPIITNYHFIGVCINFTVSHLSFNKRVSVSNG